ncbi:MAG: hypothetical protein ACR2IE_05460 [Candidatus Sumerlaeaceae bacterium]
MKAQMLALISQTRLPLGQKDGPGFTFGQAQELRKALFAELGIPSKSYYHAEFIREPHGGGFVILHDDSL